MSTQAHVDGKELHKFTSAASTWWDVNSSTFGPLHSMNHVRVPLVHKAVAAAPCGAALADSSSKFDAKQSNNGAVDDAMDEGAATPAQRLGGLTVLDVGCGGGIFAEGLARTGGYVTGVDPGRENIEAAREHAKLDDRLEARLTYLCTTAEEFAASGVQFDVVVSSEVVEHVPDVASFVGACSQMVKPGGALLMTTMNRTWASHLAAIVMAERVFGLLEPGTHDWNKFVKPSELKHVLEHDNGLRVSNVTGLWFNPLCNEWGTWRDTNVNYATAAFKPTVS